MTTTQFLIALAGLVFGSTGFWSIIVTMLNRKYKQQDKEAEETKKMKEALLAVLHDRLYQTCKYYLHTGHISSYALKNLEYLHGAYAGFGGNSTGTELFERCKHLPLKDDEEWLEKL